MFLSVAIFAMLAECGEPEQATCGREGCSGCWQRRYCHGARPLSCLAAGVSGMVVPCHMRSWYVLWSWQPLRASEGGYTQMSRADMPLTAVVASLCLSVVPFNPPGKVVWAVRNKYIGNTFFDASASAFFLQNVTKKEVRPSRGIGQTVAAKESSSVGPDWTFQGVGKQQPDPTSARSPQPFLDIQFECELGDVRGGEGSSPVLARLTNGVYVEADFVVSATGATPVTSVVSSEFEVKLFSRCASRALGSWALKVQLLE